MGMSGLSGLSGLALHAIDGYLVRDLFTEESDTALVSHTPDIDVQAGGWAITGGTWTVIAASDDLQTASTSSVAYIDAGQDNVDVRCKITTAPGPASDPGLVARFADASNLIAMFILAEENQCTLWKNVSGTWTQLGSSSITIDVSTEYELRLTIDGDDQITTYVDGVQQHQVTDAANAGNTSVGLYSSDLAGGNHVYDDFECRPF